MVIAVIVKPDNIYTFFTKFHLIFTCWLSWVISLLNVIIVICGYKDIEVIKTEDIARMVIAYEEVGVFYIILCSILILILNPLFLSKKSLKQFKECLCKSFDIDD